METPDEPEGDEEPQAPVPDPAPHIPHLLPVRLPHREAPLGCALFTGLGLTSIAGGIWWMDYEFAGGEAGWQVHLLLGVFAFFGLLILWSWLRQKIVARTPPPIIEISEQPLALRRAARIAIIQRGPAHLKSLRANLICLEQTYSWHKRNTRGPDGSRESYRQTREKLLLTENLIDASEVRATGGDTWQEIREFQFPENARPSREADNGAILWRIEVWGKAGLLGSFRHTYELDVVRK